MFAKRLVVDPEIEPLKFEWRCK